MGLFGFGRKEKALSATPAVLEAFRNRQVNPYPALGGTNVNSRVAGAYQRGIDASYGWMYRTQPAVRSVVDYIADNTAQLTLHCYLITAEGERERANDHPAAQSLRYPNQQTTQKAFLRGLVTDYLIFNNAYFIKFPGLANGRLALERVLPDQVTLEGGRFSVDAYWFWREDGTWYGPIRPEAIFHWHGPNPADPLLGLSKLETLRQELASDSAIATAMVELAKQGLKPGHIERPGEAPEWAPEDRDRFFELWKKARLDPQGTPILDEGMTWVQENISPKDAEVIGARQFTREEVAREFGMEKFPPQSEEERLQFYSDVLAPLIGQLAAQLDLDILQREYRSTDHCFEFDLNEKAYKDPWRLWSIFTSAAGAPFATRDEIRGLVGWPALGGAADKLIVPSNVIEEDPNSPSLPAPNVMPIQDPNKPPQDGSYRTNGKRVPLVPSHAKTDARRDEWAKKYEDVLVEQFSRQEQAFKSAQGRKQIADERWNRELATKIGDVSRRHFAAEGQHAAFRLATTFDPEQGQNWLAAKANDAAAKINLKTQEQINELDAITAFTIARDQRAGAAGMGYATDVAAFAAKVALEIAPGKRMVTIDGGDCPVCAEYQGAWPADEVPGWPSYHPGCNCVAVPS